jgi:hypothetical protein
MHGQSFHKEATFMAGSVLFGPKLSDRQEIDMLCSQNAYLKQRLAELAEINSMQLADLESKQIELTQGQTKVKQLTEVLAANEMSILSLHINLCQKDIELCRLRLAMFKLQHRGIPYVDN